MNIRAHGTNNVSKTLHAIAKTAEGAATPYFMGFFSPSFLYGKNKGTYYIQEIFQNMTGTTVIFCSTHNIGVILCSMMFNNIFGLRFCLKSDSKHETWWVENMIRFLLACKKFNRCQLNLFF